MLISIWQWVSGKKTYIVAVASLIYAAYGFSQGFLTQDQAMQIVMPALLAMGIRHGMPSKGQQEE